MFLWIAFQWITLWAQCALAHRWSWSCVHVIYSRMFLWPGLVCCLVQFCWGYNFPWWWIRNEGTLLLKGGVPLTSWACGHAPGAQKVARTELDPQTIQKKTWLVFLWISNPIGTAARVLDLMEGRWLLGHGWALQGESPFSAVGLA